jgi:hypothetical protein
MAIQVLVEVMPDYLQPKGQAYKDIQCIHTTYWIVLLQLLEPTKKWIECAFWLLGPSQLQGS